MGAGDAGFPLTYSKKNFGTVGASTDPTGPVAGKCETPDHQELGVILSHPKCDSEGFLQQESSRLRELQDTFNSH